MEEIQSNVKLLKNDAITTLGYKTHTLGKYFIWGTIIYIVIVIIVFCSDYFINETFETNIVYYEILFTIGSVASAITIGLLQFSDLKYITDSKLNNLNNEIYNILDCGYTSYFNPPHYELRNGKYVQVSGYENIVFDRLGLPIISQDIPLNDFKMEIFVKRNPNIFNIDKETDFNRLTRIWLIGKRTLIVRSYAGRFLIIHRNEYGKFLEDQKKYFSNYNGLFQDKQKKFEHNNDILNDIADGLSKFVNILMPNKDGDFIDHIPSRIVNIKNKYFAPLKSKIIKYAKQTSDIYTKNPSKFLTSAPYIDYFFKQIRKELTNNYNPYFLTSDISTIDIINTNSKRLYLECVILNDLDKLVPHIKNYKYNQDGIKNKFCDILMTYVNNDQTIEHKDMQTKLKNIEIKLPNALIGLNMLYDNLYQNNGSINTLQLIGSLSQERVYTMFIEKELQNHNRNIRNIRIKEFTLKYPSLLEYINYIKSSLYNEYQGKDADEILKSSISTGELTQENVQQSIRMIESIKGKFNESPDSIIKRLTKSKLNIQYNQSKETYSNLKQILPKTEDLQKDLRKPILGELNMLNKQAKQIAEHGIKNTINHNVAAHEAAEAAKTREIAARQKILDGQNKQNPVQITTEQDKQISDIPNKQDSISIAKLQPVHLISTKDTVSTNTTAPTVSTNTTTPTVSTNKFESVHLMPTSVSLNGNLPKLTDELNMAKCPSSKFTNNINFADPTLCKGERIGNNYLQLLHPDKNPGCINESTTLFDTVTKFCKVATVEPASRIKLINISPQKEILAKNMLRSVMQKRIQNKREAEKRNDNILSLPNQSVNMPPAVPHSVEPLPNQSVNMPPAVPHSVEPLSIPLVTIHPAVTNPVEPLSNQKKDSISEVNHSTLDVLKLNMEQGILTQELQKTQDNNQTQELKDLKQSIKDPTNKDTVKVFSEQPEDAENHVVFQFNTDNHPTLDVLKLNSNPSTDNPKSPTSQDGSQTHELNYLSSSSTNKMIPTNSNSRGQKNDGPAKNIRKRTVSVRSFYSSNKSSQLTRSNTARNLDSLTRQSSSSTKSDIKVPVVLSNLLKRNISNLRSNQKSNELLKENLQTKLDVLNDMFKDIESKNKIQKLKDDLVKLKIYDSLGFTNIDNEIVKLYKEVINNTTQKIVKANNAKKSISTVFKKLFDKNRKTYFAVKGEHTKLNETLVDIQTLINSNKEKIIFPNVEHIDDGFNIISNKINDLHIDIDKLNETNTKLFETHNSTLSAYTEKMNEINQQIKSMDTDFDMKLKSDIKTNITKLNKLISELHNQTKTQKNLIFNHKDILLKIKKIQFTILNDESIYKLYLGNVSSQISNKFAELKELSKPQSIRHIPNLEVTRNVEPIHVNGVDRNVGPIHITEIESPAKPIEKSEKEKEFDLYKLQISKYINELNKQKLIIPFDKYISDHNRTNSKCVLSNNDINIMHTDLFKIYSEIDNAKHLINNELITNYNMYDNLHSGSDFYTKVFNRCNQIYDTIVSKCKIFNEIHLKHVESFIKNHLNICVENIKSKSATQIRNFRKSYQTNKNFKNLQSDVSNIISLNNIEFNKKQIEGLTLLIKSEIAKVKELSTDINTYIMNISELNKINLIEPIKSNFSEFEQVLKNITNVINEQETKLISEKSINRLSEIKTVILNQYELLNNFIKADKFKNENILILDFIKLQLNDIDSKFKWFDSDIENNNFQYNKLIKAQKRGKGTNAIDDEVKLIALFKKFITSHNLQNIEQNINNIKLFNTFVTESIFIISKCKEYINNEQLHKNVLIKLSEKLQLFKTFNKDFGKFNTSQINKTLTNLDLVLPTLNKKQIVDTSDIVHNANDLNIAKQKIDAEVKRRKEIKIEQERLSTIAEVERKRVEEAAKIERARHEEVAKVNREKAEAAAKIDQEKVAKLERINQQKLIDITNTTTELKLIIADKLSEIQKFSTKLIKNKNYLVSKKIPNSNLVVVERRLRNYENRLNEYSNKPSLTKEEVTNLNTSLTQFLNANNKYISEDLINYNKSVFNQSLNNFEIVKNTLISNSKLYNDLIPIVTKYNNLFSTKKIEISQPYDVDNSITKESLLSGIHFDDIDKFEASNLQLNQTIVKLQSNSDEIINNYNILKSQLTNNIISELINKKNTLISYQQEIVNANISNIKNVKNKHYIDLIKVITESISRLEIQIKNIDITKSINLIEDINHENILDKKNHLQELISTNRKVATDRIKQVITNTVLEKKESAKLTTIENLLNKNNIMYEELKSKVELALTKFNKSNSKCLINNTDIEDLKSKIALNKSNLIAEINKFQSNPNTKLTSSFYDAKIIKQKENIELLLSNLLTTHKESCRMLYEFDKLKSEHSSYIHKLKLVKTITELINKFNSTALTKIKSIDFNHINNDFDNPKFIETQQIKLAKNSIDDIKGLSQLLLNDIDDLNKYLNSVVANIKNLVTSYNNNLTELLNKNSGSRDLINNCKKIISDILPALDDINILEPILNSIFTKISFLENKIAIINSDINKQKLQVLLDELKLVDASITDNESVEINDYNIDHKDVFNIDDLKNLRRNLILQQSKLNESNPDYKKIINDNNELNKLIKETQYLISNYKNTKKQKFDEIKIIKSQLLKHEQDLKHAAELKASNDAKRAADAVAQELKSKMNTIREFINKFRTNRKFQILDFNKNYDTEYTKINNIYNDEYIKEKNKLRKVELSKSSNDNNPSDYTRLHYEINNLYNYVIQKEYQDIVSITKFKKNGLHTNDNQYNFKHHLTEFNNRYKNLVNDYETLFKQWESLSNPKLSDAISFLTDGLKSIIFKEEIPFDHNELINHLIDYRNDIILFQNNENFKKLLKPSSDVSTNIDINKYDSHINKFANLKSICITNNTKPESVILNSNNLNCNKQITKFESLINSRLSLINSIKNLIECKSIDGTQQTIKLINMNILISEMKKLKELNNDIDKFYVDLIKFEESITPLSNIFTVESLVNEYDIKISKLVNSINNNVDNNLKQSNEKIEIITLLLNDILKNKVIVKGNISTILDNNKYQFNYMTIFDKTRTGYHNVNESKYATIFKSLYDTYGASTTPYATLLFDIIFNILTNHIKALNEYYKNSNIIQLCTDINTETNALRLKLNKLLSTQSLINNKFGDIIIPQYKNRLNKIIQTVENSNVSYTNLEINLLINHLNPTGILAYQTNKLNSLLKYDFSKIFNSESIVFKFVVAYYGTLSMLNNPNGNSDIIKEFNESYPTYLNTINVIYNKKYEYDASSKNYETLLTSLLNNYGIKQIHTNTEPTYKSESLTRTNSSSKVKVLTSSTSQKEIILTANPNKFKQLEPSNSKTPRPKTRVIYQINQHLI